MFLTLEMIRTKNLKKNPVQKKQRALSSARAALDARERELAAREAALARAEEEVRRQRASAAAGASSSAAAGGDGREKNWPPCCSVLHHDIQGEIPADAQGAVTSAYRAYLGLVLCLVYNCAAAFARLAANKVSKREDGGALTIVFSRAATREREERSDEKRPEKNYKLKLEKTLNFF